MTAVEAGGAGRAGQVDRQQPRPRWLIPLGILAVLLTVAGVLGLGLYRRFGARAEAAQRRETLARGPRVRVVAAEPSPATRRLVLPGEARPFASVILYAKISGFLSNIWVDKGDRVKKGQLLALLESPELDKQLQAASADARNRKVTAQRYTALAPTGVVSPQDQESTQAAADVATATEQSLLSQRGYKQLRAPFDGTVTARFADPGTLIQSAANGQTGAVPVVTVSRTDALRIYVFVDQQTAPFVRIGDHAEVRVAERPGWSRVAKVTRASGALDTRTRTMLTEVDVENSDDAILPGSLVQVVLTTKIPALIQVPAEALLTRADQTFVAVVDSGSRVHYRPVRVADDDGQMVRLLDGLHEGERVVLSLGNDAEDGGPVQVVEPPKPSSP